MNNVDYDKEKFDMDEYGNLIPKTKKDKKKGIDADSRYGKKIHSPLVMEGEAHLIIGLEPLEALRACYFGSKENETTFLVNNYKIIPITVPILKQKYPNLNKIFENLKHFSSKVIVINASEIVKKEIGSIIPTNIFILGYTISKELMPLKRKCVLEAVEDIVPEKYLDLNRRVFEMGESKAQSEN